MADDGAGRLMATVHDMQFGHFSGRVGESFAITVGGDRLSLILEAAQEVPGSPRPGGAFRLEFLGPADPLLDQGIYPFEIGEDRFEIFVVAIGRNARGIRYDAVFF
jgi:hypothetical protein